MTAITIKENVAARIAAISEPLANAVADALFASELNRQTNLIVEAMKLLDGAERELAKIDKPDQQSFDAAGQPVGTALYSKGRIDAIDAARKKVKRIADAIDAVFRGDLGPIQKLSSKDAKDAAE